MKNTSKQIVAVFITIAVAAVVSFYVIIPAVKIASIKKAILEIQKMPGFERSTVVVDAKYDGAKNNVISENEDVLIHPGSNYKLLTAAASLFYLKPDFTFKTDFYIFESNGKRNLIIEGHGDPTLRLEEIQTIAAQIKAKNIFINGNLYYDDRYFYGEKYGPDWKPEWRDIHFAVPITALQIGDNLLYIQSKGSGKKLAIETYPLKNYQPVVDKRKLVGKKDSYKISAKMAENGAITIEGETSGDNEFYTSANIKNPSLVTAEVFKQEFVSFGIMAKQAQVLPFKSAKTKQLIYEYSSPPLSEIVRRMLTFSKNNFGETLIRVLGNGSQAKGAEVLKKFLVEEVGIAPEDFIGVDGSGMSPSSRITGRAIMRLFDYVNGQPWKDVYWNALPTSNNEGTLMHRFLGVGLDDKVIAKTGTHDFASSLSGKIVRKSDAILFDIHIFNHKIPAENIGIAVHPVIDMVIKLLDERL